MEEGFEVLEISEEDLIAPRAREGCDDPNFPGCGGGGGGGNGNPYCQYRP